VEAHETKSKQEIENLKKENQNLREQIETLKNSLVTQTDIS